MNNIEMLITSLKNSDSVRFQIEGGPSLILSGIEWSTSLQNGTGGDELVLRFYKLEVEKQVGKIGGYND